MLLYENDVWCAFLLPHYSFLSTSKHVHVCLLCALQTLISNIYSSSDVIYCLTKSTLFLSLTLYLFFWPFFSLALALALSHSLSSLLSFFFLYVAVCEEIFICLFLNYCIHDYSKLFSDLLKSLLGWWKMLSFSTVSWWMRYVFLQPNGQVSFSRFQSVRLLFLLYLLFVCFPLFLSHFFYTLPFGRSISSTLVCIVLIRCCEFYGAINHFLVGNESDENEFSHKFNESSNRNSNNNKN